MTTELSTIYPTGPRPLPTNTYLQINTPLVVASASTATFWIEAFVNNTGSPVYVDAIRLNTGGVVTQSATFDSYLQVTGSDPGTSPTHTVGTQATFSTSTDVGVGINVTLSSTQADRVVAPGESLWFKVIGVTGLVALPLNIVTTLRAF